MAAIMVIKCVGDMRVDTNFKDSDENLLSIPYNIIVINIFSLICIAT
jgi:hypothetical protein